MKPVAQGLTSVVFSLVASVVATWLLRRLIFLAERPGNGEGGPEEGGSHNNSPVIVLMPLIFSANTIGNTTLLPRRGKLPLALMRRMAATKGGRLRH